MGVDALPGGFISPNTWRQSFRTINIRFALFTCVSWVFACFFGPFTFQSHVELALNLPGAPHQYDEEEEAKECDDETAYGRRKSIKGGDLPPRPSLSQLDGGG